MSAHGQAAVALRRHSLTHFHDRSDICGHRQPYLIIRRGCTIGFPSDEAAASFFDKYERPAGTIHLEVQEEPIGIVKRRSPAQAHRELAISKLSKFFEGSRLRQSHHIPVTLLLLYLSSKIDFPKIM